MPLVVPAALRAKQAARLGAPWGAGDSGGHARHTFRVWRAFPIAHLLPGGHNPGKRHHRRCQAPAEKASPAMANQHHPTDSGRRPASEVTAERPDCHRCTWVWRRGMFHLKYLAAGCLTHRLVPDDLTAQVSLVTWLGAAAS